MTEQRLSHGDIVKMAGNAAFAGGLIYQKQGRVEKVLRSDSTVAATVRGTVPYHVKLVLDTRPSWSCDCPVGEEGKFCKHCAAAAIDLLDPDDQALLPRLSKEPATGPGEQIAALSRGQLEEIVRLAAVRDQRVAQAIETAAAAAGGSPVDVEQWAKRIDTAFRTGGFVPYAEAAEWAREIVEVLDALNDLLAAGHADEVLQLAERAHRKLERSMGRVDDSRGEITDLSRLIGDLHRNAATAGSVQPVALARSLAKFELDSELDTFRRSALTYANVLGEKGLREFRKVVEPKWRRADAAAAGQWSHDRVATGEAMIGLALAGGSPDELVEVMADRMHAPGDYLEVARAMEGAGRRGEAIRWSHKGLMSAGTRYPGTQSLREFLSSLYLADGDGEAAEDLWWDAFATHPSVETYRRVLAETRSCDPARTGERALNKLHTRAGGTTDDPTRITSHASVLVEVLLYEGQFDEAWTVAVHHGVDDEIWMKLAHARESDLPLGVIAIYERVAEASLETKKSAGYEEAVRLLKRIEKLAAQGGEPLLFREVLARLVEHHGRKTTFMGLVRRAGWV